jgi:hypothetical protein
MPGPTKRLKTYSKREIKQRIACHNALKCSIFRYLRSLRSFCPQLSCVGLTNHFFYLHNTAVRQNPAFFDENNLAADLVIYQAFEGCPIIPALH